MNRKKAKAYDTVAFIYEELMNEVDYANWAKYIVDIAEEYVDSKNAQVLELAAGNCKLASEIIKTFPHLIVTDHSFTMLNYNKNVKLKKVCCDMTSLPFGNNFELIYSTFDSVNYLLSKRKLLNLFSEVKRVLSDNGIFTFDASLEKNSLDFEKAYVTEGTFGGYKYIRRSKYNKATRIHKNVFEVVDKDGNVFYEIHREKIYKFDTYFDLIDKAGLYVVECLETFTFDNGNANSDRVQFIVKKKRANVKFS